LVCDHLDPVELSPDPLDLEVDGGVCLALGGVCHQLCSVKGLALSDSGGLAQHSGCRLAVGSDARYFIIQRVTGFVLWQNRGRQKATHSSRTDKLDRQWMFSW
jgi:hypothetical protein